MSDSNRAKSEFWRFLLPTKVFDDRIQLRIARRIVRQIGTSKRGTLEKPALSNFATVLFSLAPNARSYSNIYLLCTFSFCDLDVTDSLNATFLCLLA